MKTGLVISVVVVVVVVAALSVFLLLPRGPVVREFTIDMVEYAFRQGQNNNPTLRVKVGDTVVIKFTNKGALPHEFMLFEDPNKVVGMLKDVIKEFQAKNVPEEEAIEQYEDKMHEMEDSGMIKIAFEGADIDLEPGKSGSIRFIANRAGVFTYVCLEADGTYPDIHYDKGMHGQLIVEQ